MEPLENLKKVRLEKLEKIKSLGVNPYPSKFDRLSISVARKKALNEVVKVAGRIMSFRGHGKLVFADLVDESGKIQLIFKFDVIGSEKIKFLELLDAGDFIGVEGKLFNTQAGELTVEVANYTLLAKSLLPLPSSWYKFKDVEERYRKRYLDTILNSEVKMRLLTRSKIIDSIRDFLTDRNFIEVETPTLQPLYGGGFARPFSTHHNELDTDLYLRISDEMYLKRLIIGGFEKVFEITKVFRNEGVDIDHNPEFTMFEAMIAYEDYSYGMDIIEEIIEYTAIQALGTTKFKYQGIEMDVKRPWSRFRMTEAIKKFTGVDTLTWKSIEEAKESIQTMKIAEDKLKELKKIRTIGECIAFAFEESVEEKLIQPTIIYDYPTENSPLAKKCEDPKFTQRFEMFAFGSELGNNYTELNDPLDLRKRFVEEKKREEAGFTEAHQTDYDYLEAIEHGFPPTCGIAIGIDRLVMLLTDARSIKDVIAFPILRPQKKSEPKEMPQEEKIVKASAAKKMDLGIDHQKAMELLEQYLKDPVNRKHSLEAEAIMRALAKRLGEDQETWGIIGLLHDIDWEMTKDDTKKHCIKTAEILKMAGGTPYLIETIQSHGYGQGWGDNYYGPPEFADKQRTGNVRHALAAAETLTGLIVATALIQPDKKLESVKLDSLQKKFKNQKFAANCSRNIILECEKIGLTIDEFLEIGLNALQDISSVLGL